MLKVPCKQILLLAAFISALAPSLVQAEVEISQHDDLKLFGLYEPKLNEMFARSPSEGLRYLFSKMNQQKAKRDPAVNLRFGLTFTEGSGEPVGVEPAFTKEGQFILDLRISKKLKDNPVAIFEGLTALESTIPRDGNNLEVFKSVLVKENVYGKKIDSATGEEVIDSNSVSLVEQHKHHSFKVSAALGVPKFHPPHVSHPLQWLELKTNHAGGSQLAKRELAELELETARQIRDGFFKFKLVRESTDQAALQTAILDLAAARGLVISRGQTVEDTWAAYSEARMAILQRALYGATKLARLEVREMKQKRSDPARELLKKALEAAPEKLEALVKKNDREGVAKLLEAFLPREQMSPVERDLWTQWLEAIRHPDFSKSRIMFRGIDTNDHVQVARDGKKKITGFGFFPTLLTRNQGHYTRRLRSYETMRLAVGNELTKVTYTSPKPVSPLVEMPKVTSIMANHARNPIGSPFLSFTTELALAASYSEERNIAVVRVDERRILPNALSMFKGESELLVAMMIFPDEVIHYPNFPKNTPLVTATADWKQAFLAEASAKLGAEVPAGAAGFTGPFDGAFRIFGEIHARVARSQSCRSAF